MIVQNSERKQLVQFLMRRWLTISGLAAAERVFVAACKYAEDNNHPAPEAPEFIFAQPCRQIEIIKQQIIATLPEANFIDYVYEAPAPLDPQDFVELYVAEQLQCMTKVNKLMKKMHVK